MNFLISEQFLNFELGNLFRIFYPYEELTVKNEDIENPDFSVIIKENKAFLTVKKQSEVIEIIKSKDDIEHRVCKKFFSMLCKENNYSPKWGMLTGIHPVKLFAEYERKIGTEMAINHFATEMSVSKEKTDFAKSIADIEKRFVENIGENDFSLYVSIPFCPSRCSYCSFVSQSIEKKEKLIAPYFELLLKEIEYTAKIANINGLVLKSVYIGGGTPTTLSAVQLKDLIDKIRELFDFSNCDEFTVEAGRPDTIDREKLLTLKKCGIGRISINPQSLNDEVLKLIGRNHSSKEFLEKYQMAKELGFEIINTDLIAGLEGDDFESFANTLDRIIELSPENITVHSLALKRSAKIFREKDTKDYHGDRNSADKMIEYSVKKLSENGYLPYYLYRQSRMAGNCENTGWAKKDCECAYNIYTMDESQTILACGAGAVTKL
ncbi:MAG: coproporphyrinogen dehydrogenase HemZ, partial [Clostridia bacterium]